MEQVLDALSKSKLLILPIIFFPLKPALVRKIIRKMGLWPCLDLILGETQECVMQQRCLLPMRRYAFVITSGQFYTDIFFVRKETMKDNNNELERWTDHYSNIYSEKIQIIKT